MNNPATDILHMLQAYGDSSGLDVDLGTDVFINREPAAKTIKNCITIFDTSGYPPYLGLTDVGYEYPSINIRVRNRSQLSGWNIIESIKTALHGRNHETWNGTLYTRIACASGPALLGWDDDSNCSWVINFDLQRRPA